MDMEQIQAVEKIDPRPLEPWRQSVFKDINIEIDRDTASQKADMLITTPEAVIYTDTSAKQSTLGAAAVMLAMTGKGLGEPASALPSTGQSTPRNCMVAWSTNLRSCGDLSLIILLMFATTRKEAKLSQPLPCRRHVKAFDSGLRRTKVSNRR